MGFLRVLLYQIHWTVVLSGIALCVVSLRGSRKLNAFLLAAYLVFIVYMTLMGREAGNGRLQLKLFWSYRLFWSHPRVRMEILNNIWLFVPLGTILYRLFPRAYIVFVPVLISIAVEVSQYLLGVGLCEVDDVISNGLGGLIGILVGLLADWVSRDRGSK